MRREVDSDFHCPQAALVSEEIIRRTEKRLARYRQQIKDHHDFLETRERMMQRKQWMGQYVLVAAAAAALGVLIWRRKSKQREKDTTFSGNTFNVDDEYSKSPEKLRQEFDTACSVAKSFPDGYLDQRDQLMVYGLYKQALIGDRTENPPSKLNIVATEKYKAWGRFTGLPQEFAMMKYIEVINHFASGGKSSFTDSASAENDDIQYEEDEQVDEDGCPIDGEEEFGGLGVRQSMMKDETQIEIDGNATPDSHLRQASIHCDTKLLQKAIHDGADVNGTDESGQTALHFAVDRGNMECILLLIENGANVNALDNDGIGVLLTAVMAGNIEVIKLLLEKGANPDAEDEDGETPRSWVIEDGNTDIMNLFAKYPAS